MTRIDIINGLIARFGYTSYVEIGVANGFCFRQINVTDKVGVDPAKDSVDLKIDSDTFFLLNDRPWDIIFIDGLHHWEQCLRDINHAMKVAKCVVCHDMLPTTEAMQAVPRVEKVWTGDVWRAWLKLDCPRLVVDTDYGVGVIHPGLVNFPAHDDVTFAQWLGKRNELMNVVTPSQWLSILSSLPSEQPQRLPG